MSRIAHWLQKRGGFWFPAVRWFLDRLFRALSLSRCLNAYLHRKSLGGPWVSELYQLFVVLLGLGLIALIEWPVLTGSVWIVFGLIVAFYRVLEILLFSLHWLLVAEGPVESYRRSLLGFLINFFEIGLFFAIAYLLLGWFDPPKAAWSALQESLGSVFSLETLSSLREARGPQALALLQLGISWGLVALILANVVSAIDRGERTRKTGGDSV